MGLVFVILDSVHFFYFVIDVRRGVAFDYKMCAKRIRVPPQDDLSIEILDPFLHRVGDGSTEDQLLLKLDY